MKRIFRFSISKYFVNGLIILVPVTITLTVVLTIFNFTETWIGKVLPIKFPGMGVLAVALLIVLVGWFSSNWIMKEILHFGDRMIASIPVVNFLYKSVQQVSKAMLGSQQTFRQAVLVEYPGTNAKAIGFLASPLSTELADAVDEESVCVYIPFSFNMTAGLNLIVARKDVVFLDVAPESALQYVLTGGAIMPKGTTPKV